MEGVGLAVLGTDEVESLDPRCWDMHIIVDVDVDGNCLKDENRVDQRCDLKSFPGLLSFLLK